MGETWIDRVRQWMTASGTSQGSLARALDCTRGAVGHYLAGRRQPTLAQMEQLSAPDGLVVEELSQGAEIERAGVGVGGGDENVGSGDAGFFAGEFAGLSGDVGGYANDVAEDQGGGCRALLEDEGLGLQGVVGAGVKPFAKIAAHPVSQGGRDVGDGHADSQVSGESSRGKQNTYG